MSRSIAVKTVCSNWDTEEHILTLVKKRLAWYGISDLKLKSISQHDANSISVKLRDEATKKEFITCFELNVFEKHRYDGEVSSLAA